MRRCRRVGGESGRGDDPGWLTLLSREVAVVPVCTPAMMQADPDGTGLATVAIATGALIFGDLETWRLGVSLQGNTSENRK